MHSKVLFDLILVTSLFTIAAIAARVSPNRSRGEGSFPLAAKVGIILNLCLVLGVFTRLVFGLVTDDITLAYVAKYSSPTLPWLYKIASLWSGREGALLLWLCFTSLTTVFAVFRVPGMLRRTGAIAGLVLTAETALFSSILRYATPLLVRTSSMTGFGTGISQALQSPFNLLHPPATFLGYACFGAAFALLVGYGIAAKGAQEPDAQIALLAHVRQWVLLGWSLLTVSILLGGAWAYLHFAGRYWRWDPIENSALLIWLLAGAAVHLLARDRLNHRLHRTTALCVCLVFLSLLLSSYLTRSGLLRLGRNHLTDPSAGYFLLAAAASALVFLLASARVNWSRDPAPCHKPANAAPTGATLQSATVLLASAAVLVFCGTALPLLLLPLGKTVVLPEAVFTIGLAPLGLGVVLLCISTLLSRHHAFAAKLVHLGLSLLLLGVYLGGISSSWLPQDSLETVGTQVVSEPAFFRESLVALGGIGGLLMLTGMLMAIHRGNGKESQGVENPQ